MDRKWIIYIVYAWKYQPILKEITAVFGEHKQKAALEI